MGEEGRELPLVGGRVLGPGGLVGLPVEVAGFQHPPGSLYPHL